ncbi:hypothetical protein Lal_00041636 [Lupinus albus]|nr:hypothetical protein Lal_00041636 [Lupinus albus]
MFENDKAVEPDNIPIEAWKDLGEWGIRCLAQLFNEIMRSKVNHKDYILAMVVKIKISKEPRDSHNVFIYLDKANDKMSIEVL